MHTFTNPTLQLAAQACPQLADELHQIDFDLRTYQEQGKAWMAVFDALHEAMGDDFIKPRLTGKECALAAIAELVKARDNSTK